MHLRMRELEEGTSLREIEKHIQEIRFHSLSCCPGSRNNDCSDCGCIAKRPEVCYERSWKWFEDSWK